MLSKISIKNYILIDELEVDLAEGLNIITGETGAGKSIVIGAINSILGKRISKDLIRTGANSAFVSATFDNLSPTVLEKIKKAGYALDEDQLLIISIQYLAYLIHECCQANDIYHLLIKFDHIVPHLFFHIQSLLLEYYSLEVFFQVLK